MSIWTGLGWPRIETGGTDACECGNEPWLDWHGEVNY